MAPPPEALPVSELRRETFKPPGAGAPDGADRVWAAVLAAAGRAHAGPVPAGSYALGPDGVLVAVPPAAPEALLEHDGGAWGPAPGLPAPLAVLVDLYAPQCAPGGAPSVAVGHLGQSLDGYVATRSGDSTFVNGPENILHLHRLRALSDAVVVGASTVASDDPRLTTRLARGANPVRVVLDPRRRLDADRRIFNDGEAPTLLVCAEDVAYGRPRIGRAEVLGVRCREGRLDLAALLDALAARGLRTVLVEGGGETVSRFLEAGLLARVQIAVAPLIMGRGRPGLRLPGTERIAECLRPAPRIFAMGADVLFDCDLTRAPAAAPAGVRRVL